ncbi:peptidase S8/S53 domain-containing protein [Scleroderma yunnanense]
MHLLLLTFVTFNLFLVAFADPNLSPYVIHEKRIGIPSGWSLAHRHDASSTLPLRFALKQKNIEHVGEFLLDVSDPNSPNYGKHWTASDIVRKFAPSNDSIDAVRAWFLESGIEAHRITLSSSKGWINVHVSVEEAERLMNTEYNVYKHVSGTKHIACEAYYLPEHISKHVDFVLPSVHFDAKLGRRSANDGPDIKVGVPGSGFNGLKKAGVFKDSFTNLENCDQATTPACLRALYDLYHEPQATDRNSYGIVEYTPQAFVQSDLQLFAKNYSHDLVGKSPGLVSIDGGVVQTTQTGIDYNGESNLDLQYGMALVTGKQPVQLYQVGDLVEGASFNNFLDAIDGSYCTFEGGDDPNQPGIYPHEDGIYPDPNPNGYKGKDCGTVKPALVISTSYGYNEADLTYAYAARQCTEYAKLGLQGITVLYGSGDNGVAGSVGNCLNDNGTQSTDGKRFNPGFPASCPWITSVGATMVKPNATVFEPQPEQACEINIYSGGGFSNYFAMPDYQKYAVEGWIQKYGQEYVNDYGNAWNSTGKSRAIPDISANGANYVIAIDGAFTFVSGTSASTRTLGAILTMVNDVRLLVNQPPIGFINPALYSSNATLALNDVTEGNNPGCGTNGFNATVGWDPVTGLGTPRFLGLLGVFIPAQFDVTALVGGTKITL